MSTYTCYECRGVFSGRGLVPNIGGNVYERHCPGCTLVLEQRHRMERQRISEPIDDDMSWISDIFTINRRW